MITSMNHISFTVSNLDRSVSFYKNVLGLKLLDICERDTAFSEQVTGIEGAHLKIAYLNANNCSVELIEYISPKGESLDTTTCNVGSAHVCFNVDAFNELTDKLKNNHVKFCGAICTIPAGPNEGKKVLYFKDPDLNTIEFISNDIC